MQGDAPTLFIKEILPLLVANVALCLTLIWFPWNRLVWLPKDPGKVDEDIRTLLSAGDAKGACALVQKTYGLCPEHARAIVEATKQKPPHAPHPASGHVPGRG